MEKTILKMEDIDDGWKNKAFFLMLKGKALNVTSSYSQQAEDALSKAVKLDPGLVEGWNQLGEAYWKKMDVASAKTCFSGALNHMAPLARPPPHTSHWPVWSNSDTHTHTSSRPAKEKMDGDEDGLHRGSQAGCKNKVSLRNLSMVMRQQRSGDAEENSRNIMESVKQAKQAVQMDTRDGTSWCRCATPPFTIITQHTALSLQQGILGNDMQMGTQCHLLLQNHF
ncbi:tetratricopeptide repeat protein 5-like isoform X3 [Ascaphus truei]